MYDKIQITVIVCKPMISSGVCFCLKESVESLFEMQFRKGSIYQNLELLNKLEIQKKA